MIPAFVLGGCGLSRVTIFDGYKLVWADEFDSGTEPEYPNSDNWGYERGYVRNREWQYYADSLDDAYCQNGMLHIRALKHAPGTFPTGPDPYQDGSISSASLRSLHKVEYMYGKLQMRARIDTRMGSWPAFWTLGVKGGWPDGGECDIMEYYRDMLKFNIAWQTPESGQYILWDSTVVNLYELEPNWADDFHVWTMEWSPEFIKLYLDDELMNEWDSSQDASPNGDSAEGFQQPHYIILNQAIGGNEGGDASGLQYPTSYEIDWVRWYQKKY